MSSFYKKVLVSLLSLVAIVFAYKALGAGYTPPPSIYYLGASPSTVIQYNSSTISWNVVNAYTCYGSGGWSGLKSIPSGSYTVTPGSTTTYTLTCNNEVGATTSRSITINVTPMPTTTTNSCSCYADPSAYCYVQDNGSGCVLVSDRYTTQGLTACQNLLFSAPQPYCTTTPAPTVTFNANGAPSTTINYGQSATLSWSSTNATSCLGTNFSTNNTVSGSQSTGALTASARYQIQCTNISSGQTASAYADVTVTNTPVNCVGSWSACTNGTQTYTITTPNSNGGTACPYTNGTTQSCGTPGVCSSPATHYTCLSPAASTSNVNGATAWTWSCPGSNGGSTASCSESKTPVNGICSSSHYACIQGASANNVSGTSSWTWSCLGSNGGYTASCSEAKISGTLTPVASGCTILDGASSCGIQFSWNTTNPVGTSSVTSNTTDTGTATSNQVVAVGNSGSYVKFTIPYSSRTFFLYNNAQLLDQKTVTAGCASTSTWNGSVCVAGSPTAPTGVTATTVSSSKINVSWSASTGGNGSQIAYNIYRCQGAGCTPNSYIGWGYTTSFSDTGLSSNTTYGYRILAYDSRPVFSSYSSAAYATTLAGVPVVNCSTSPSSVSYGGTSTLSWSTTDATSCTMSSGGISGTQATSGSKTVGPLYSTTTYAFTCSGPGGNGSCTTSVSVGAAPSGSISSTSCTIPLGSSTCDSSVSWSTQNLIPGGQTNVTKNNPSNTVVSTATSGTNKLVAINYGTTGFFLNHNGAELATSSANASCAQGALIGGVCALVPVNGSCSSPASHYTCASGTSTNNVNGLTAWTWNCAGSNGGSTASCSETKGSGSLMSGTISATSCTIPANASTCTSSVSWTTANLVGATTEVTRDNPSNTHVSWNTSGTNVSNVINHGVSNFYLYNSADVNPLASTSVSADCTPGVTTWSVTNNRCENIPPPSPTATIIANPTSVVKGSSSTISWSSTNASSCTGTNFSTGNATSGQVTVTPNNTTTYSLVCTGVATQASDQATVTVTVNPKKPKYIEQ